MVRGWRFRMMVIGAAVLIALSLPAGCASSGGRLAYPSGVAPSGVAEIGYSAGAGSFVIGSDGAAPRGLGTGLAPGGPQTAQPITGAIVVAPDGQQEAYWRDCDQPYRAGDPQQPGLWVAGSNGAEPHRIWAAPGCYAPSRSDPADPVPQWNPAGTELAIGVNVGAYPHFGILVVGADGKGAHIVDDGSGRPLMTFSVVPFAWSPDGKSLVLQDQESRIVVAPAAGGTPRVLAPPRESAVLETLAWSPDGTTILAAIGGSLEAFPASGGPGRAIPMAGTVTGAFCAPDGRHIVVTGSRSGIEMANLDGTDVTAVPNTSGIGGSAQITSLFTVPAAPGPVAPSPGYWVATSDGQVASYGGAYSGPQTPAKPSTPVGAIIAGLYTYGNSSPVGYILLGIDGQMTLAGPTASTITFAHRGPKRIVAVCQNDFVSGDGSFYLFGGDDSKPLAVATQLTAPVVSAMCSYNTNLLVTADGKVYSQPRGGHSAVEGPTQLFFEVTGMTAPIVGAASDPATGGFWLVGRDGNVYSYNAPLQGSLRGEQLSSPVTGIAADIATGGYWIVTEDGAVHGFNAPTEQQTGGPSITSQVIGIAPGPYSTSATNAF